MRDRTKIYFDGGLRPLPTGMEIAVVVRGAMVIESGLGAGTSQEAEWRALLRAIEVARDRDVRDYVLLGDSAAVIGQATGAVRTPAQHASFVAAMFALCHGRTPHLRWIPRTQNLAGIALARTHIR